MRVNTVNTSCTDVVTYVPLYVEEACWNPPQFVSQIYTESDNFGIKYNIEHYSIRNHMLFNLKHGLDIFKLN